MIKFKLNKVEYKIPTILSIDNYVKIYKIKDLFTDEYFSAKLVSIVCGAPLEELLDTDYQQVDYVATEILKLVPTEKPKFKDRFELNGVQYGFFPSWEDLSFAEFIDMDTLSTKKEEELLNVLHILSAIMYRPITEEKNIHDFKIEKYDLEKMKVRAEIFKKELDVNIVLGAQFFFINYASRFSSYIQLSLMKKPSWMMTLKLLWVLRIPIWKRLFSKRSGGSLSSIELAEMILRNTKRYTKAT
jgi:hypothetical protein